jgi:hypothetical protein
VHTRFMQMLRAAARSPLLIACCVSGVLSAAAAVRPSTSCDSLARASLGTNVTVLSATPSTTGGGGGKAGPLSAPCKAVVRSLCGAVAPAGCQQCVTHNAAKEIGAGCPTGSGAAAEVINFCRHLGPDDEPPAAVGGDTDQESVNVSFCLVKVLVQPAINIWVGLPSEWNQKFQALGGGGYAGRVVVPTAAVLGGFVGATTDTGHEGGSGTFGMLRPGVPNVGLQVCPAPPLHAYPW